MDETVVIISDLHLGQNDDFDIFAGPAKSQTFVDFMKFMGTRAGTVEVVINGDFVDFLQLRPWDVKVDRETAAKKIKNIVAAHKDTVFRALGEFLASPSHKVTVLLGNHDIELAFPEVWKHVVDAILEVVTGATADRLSSLAIDRTRITYVKPVGGVLVHIEHGNMDDPYNGMNYTALFQDAERGTDKFAYPPGTQLVYDIMNRHKAEFRFVDLLKPEVPAVPLLLMALKPKAVVDVPGIGLKSLAALGNGFIGWLRTKISGPTLGRAGEATPQEADENQLSKDIAAAYQDATDTAGGITQADAALLQQFFESSGEDQIAVQPVLGPSIEGAKKRLVQAAIRSLGRPVDLRDTTYYYLDHRDRDDVKWAQERLTGKVKVVVFGHTHRPLKTEFEGGGLYLNSGAWANQITLPAPADNLSDWMSRIRTNSDQNRAAFPTYITLTAEDGGATGEFERVGGRGKIAMAETYSSLKVTISDLGDKKYLSLLDSGLPGVGGGSGQEFTFDPEAPPAGTPKLSEFLKALATGAIPSASYIENFGKLLFDRAFGGENGFSYRTAVALAQSMHRRLRICMNVLTPDLIDVPWEYLHDGGGFVIKRGPAIVRLLEGVAANESSFAPVQKLLIGVANPTKSEAFVPFDAEAHLKTVGDALRGIGGLTITPLLHPRLEDIEQALRQNRFDAFYFVGHGVYLKDGGGHLVCENQGEPVFLPADDLAAWIRESNSLRFVYLNSCSTAVTSGVNPIQGVAQRLMRDGRVSAVAAMQADVNQASAQRIAENFFKLLSDDKSPEDAMLLSRTKAGDLHSFGVPVLYSTLDAPAQFERNRLAALLSMTEDSSCALLLPSWIMGLPGKAGEAANLKGLEGDQYYYRGPTFATADVSSAWSIANLVGSVLPPDKIQLRSNHDVGNVIASHRFVFGSQSSGILAGVLELFEPEFSFDYKPADAPGYWVIRDQKNGNCYEIQKPNDLDYETYLGTTDYGVIQKFTDKTSQRVYFLIAGLGSRATEGCGYFLRDHWEELLREFGNQDFGIVVKFPQNLGPQEGQRQPRETGKRPCSEISKRMAAKN